MLVIRNQVVQTHALRFVVFPPDRNQRFVTGDQLELPDRRLRDSARKMHDAFLSD
jgi:hypothetical protein